MKKLSLIVAGLSLAASVASANNFTSMNKTDSQFLFDGSTKAVALSGQEMKQTEGKMATITVNQLKLDILSSESAKHDEMVTRVAAVNDILALLRSKGSVISGDVRTANLDEIKAPSTATDIVSLGNSANISTIPNFLIP